MDENWENSIESRPSIRCHNGNLFVWKICPAVEEGKTNGEILKKAHEFPRFGDFVENPRDFRLFPW